MHILGQLAVHKCNRVVAASNALSTIHPYTTKQDGYLAICSIRWEHTAPIQTLHPFQFKILNRLPRNNAYFNIYFATYIAKQFAVGYFIGPKTHRHTQIDTNAVCTAGEFSIGIRCSCLILIVHLCFCYFHMDHMDAMFPGTEKHRITNFRSTSFTAAGALHGIWYQNGYYIFRSYIILRWLMLLLNQKWINGQLDTNTDP